MMKKMSFTLAMLAVAFGFSNCTSDDIIADGNNDEKNQNEEIPAEVVAAKEEIGTILSSCGVQQAPPMAGPSITRESYHWEYAVDILERFPEWETPEGVYHNFVYYSNGEPFDVVMLYTNGGYKHKCGLYWYDQDGDTHEVIFWDEADENFRTWHNAYGQKTEIISRLSDEAGAYRIQLPKGTKFSFFQESYQYLDNEWQLVTEDAAIDPDGPKVPCPYKFYTEYAKNWNYQFTHEGQAMTAEINDWTIVGFEDISLTKYSCDKDFNDCVFAINPAQNVDPDPTPEVVDGSVETNFSVSKEADNTKLKISTHIRAVTDIEIIVPVVNEVLADDFAIVAKHDVEYAYSQELDINGNTVELEYSMTPEGFLKIKTIGVNEDVIEYCRNTYADGLTIECNLSYDNYELEDMPSITFTNNPTFYITSCVTNSEEATDVEVLWKSANVSNIESLNFENESGQYHYMHNVYSALTTEQLKERGLLK